MDSLTDNFAGSDGSSNRASIGLRSSIPGKCGKCEMHTESTKKIQGRRKCVLASGTTTTRSRAASLGWKTTTTLSPSVRSTTSRARPTRLKPLRTFDRLCDHHPVHFHQPNTHSFTWILTLLGGVHRLVSWSNILSNFGDNTCVEAFVGYPFILGLDQSRPYAYMHQNCQNQNMAIFARLNIRMDCVYNCKYCLYCLNIPYYENSYSCFWSGKHKYEALTSFQKEKWFVSTILHVSGW